MTLKELQERNRIVLEELAVLWQKEDRSDDDESKIDQLLAETNDLGPKIIRAKQIEDAVSSRTESRGRVSGQIPTGGHTSTEERRQAADLRSLGRRFAESDELREFVESGARSQSRAVKAGSFYPAHQRAQLLEHHNDMGPEELRDLVHTGGLTADWIAPTRVPGIFRGDDPEVVVRDVLINGTTTSDTILFFRELLFTNAAEAVAQATATGGTSGLKQESAITFEQDDAPVVTLAHWIPITRQTLADAAQVRTYVEGRLLDGLRQVEEQELLNGDGSGASMVGLRETNGIQVLDGAFWTADPVQDAGESNENFNRLLRARNQVRIVGGARANFVVLHPADFENLVTAVDAERRYYGAGPFSGPGLPPIWGMRVVESEFMDEGAAFVGDGRMAAVWDRQQAQILVDTINDQFVRNMLTILAEERLALTVFRPVAFAEVTLA